MKAVAGIFLACCLHSIAAPGVTWAADLPMTLAANERTIAGGRSVQIILSQTQIETTIDVGRVASSANGGGLLGAIIISEMDDKREALSHSARQRAEATIAPLRQALQGFDVNGLAVATTKAALAKPAWFQPISIDITSDQAIQSRPSFLASLKSPQFALIGYRYETSPDFTQIRVIAEIQLGRGGAIKGGKPMLTPFYRQRVASIMQLRKPSFEPSENAATWSADGGRLAKAALTSAFGRLERLMPLALNLSESELRAIRAKGREKAYAAGYYGPLVERNIEGPSETLIWVDGLLNVQPIGD